MKVLFTSRATLHKDPGGDTVQIINTARYLEKLGVEVNIRLCNEIIDYSGYDLVHFFNIIRPADILKHIDQSGKPYVISTIYVSYEEYEKKMRRGMAGIAFKLLSPDLIEYIKVIGRFLINGEKVVSPSYLWLGQKRGVKKIIRKASMLLPNSYNEYNRLFERYKTGNKYRVIPNAVDPLLFSAAQSTQSRDNDLVICVGRIEGRKNQLNLIRALNGTKYRLCIIGSPSANQHAYYQACKQIAGANVLFIDTIPQEQLIDYYRSARVHVLPSWFETTGLSSLEAAAMGCNIVITDKGDTREYFEEYAIYCDPGSPASILAAVEEAAHKDFNPILQKKIFEQYTWAQTAQKTWEAYQEVTGTVNK